ncbi:MAG: TetR/AcrR family transcriptional regulator [Treponema sp.]|nr:TetR/AcrR family transcriptional regulator [Treponema sp.]
MTKTEIMDAAFRVWGREFYANTSLSHVARELKVCKPALYRHFRSKQALLDAMTVHFFDDFTDFVRPGYEKALKNEHNSTGVFILARSVAEYYARNVNIFIFAMIKLHDRELNSAKMHEEFRKRGIDLELYSHSIKKTYNIQPLIMRLSFATLTFCMADFHKKGESLVKQPSEAAISKIINAIGVIIGQGLGYISEEIDALDYEGLENRILGTVNSLEDDPLLKAVASAVAEAGPWEASMEQVARRSGLSKSSLYYHFASKQDMLHQLFMTESRRIIDFARQGMQHSVIPQEQLYLGIFSIAEYLRAKPDILITLDWLRTRRPSLKPAKDNMDGPEHEFLWVFEDIAIKPLCNSPFSELKEGRISPWVLFLIASTLMRENSGQALGTVPKSDIRFLYRFVTSGIGVKENEE